MAAEQGDVLGLRAALVLGVLALASPILWLFFSPVFRLTEMPAGPEPDAAAKGAHDD